MIDTTSARCVQLTIIEAFFSLCKPFVIQYTLIE